MFKTRLDSRTFFLSNFFKIALIILAGLSFQAQLGTAATHVDCLKSEDFSSLKRLDPSQLEFETLDTADLQADLNQGGDFWPLYRSSFSPDELVTPEDVIKYMPGNRIMILRAKIANKTVGFSYVVPMKKAPVSLLGYLAVSKELQRSGLGGAILKCSLQEDARRRLEKTHELSMGFVAEFGRPDLASNDEEKNERNGVLKFYERFGGTILLPDYFMPPLRDDSPAIDMYLGYVPLTPGTPYTADFPTLVRQAVYSEVYPGYWKREGEARFGN